LVSYLSLFAYHYYFAYLNKLCVRDAFCIMAVGALP
jgi:hypothetical protein